MDIISSMLHIIYYCVEIIVSKDPIMA